MKSSSILLPCVLLFSASVHAEDVTCKPEETINECIDRLVVKHSSTLRESSPPDAADSKKIGESAAKAANDKAEAGDQPGAATGGGQATSAFTDLIPWLNMLGVLSDSDESDGTIALDLNFLLMRNRDEEAKHDSQLKWEFDVSPTPFEPLVGAIPEGVRDERTKELQGQINDTADSRLQYTYSVITQKFGRDYRQHQRAFASLIAPRVYFASHAAGQAEIKSSFDARRASFAVRLAGLLDGLRKSDDARGIVRPQSKVSDLDANEKDQLNVFVLQAQGDFAQERAKWLTSLQKSAADSRIDQLAELVMQQPQILITATKSIRDELVGPESWGLKFTFEKSLADLSGFRRYAKTAALEGEPAGVDMCAILSKDAALVANTVEGFKESSRCLNALDFYLKDRAEQIENKSRWKVALEYKQVEDWRFALPTDGVDLDLSKHDRLIGSVGFGRAVQRSAAKDRVDFEAAYDSNLDDDTTYKSRFVVTLTYTRRFGELDIPFSIVYANKSEFLEGTDKQIGLHFGIKYRALDKEKT